MQILVLSLLPEQNKSLRDFFRFHQPLLGIQYLHYCLDSASFEEDPELGLFCGYRELSLDMSSDNPLEVFNAMLSKRDTKAILFSDMETYEYWQKSQAQTDTVLYSSGLISILFDVDSEYVEPDWLRLRSLNLRRLSCESGCSKDRDITELMRNRTGKDLLVSSNRELADFFLSLDPMHTMVYYPSFPLPTQNLNLSVLKPEAKTDRLRFVLMDLEKYISLDNASSSNARLRLAQDQSLSNSGSYSFFAWHYDAYMSHVDYQSWVSNVLKWQEKHSKLPCRKILEIACGTANVSSLLVKLGYDVDACDLSPQMLEVAHEKKIKPRLFRRSMTSALPNKGYDLILCLFDSINYLQRRTEIKQVFEQVQEALTKGGIFIFDISTIQNSLENFSDNFNLSHIGDDILLHQAEYDEFSFKQKSFLNSFHKFGTWYNIEREQHVQRVYRHYEILELIDESPLSLKGIYYGDSNANHIGKKHKAIDEQYPRIFYVLSS